jgi:hypothetical protein
MLISNALRWLMIGGIAVAAVAAVSVRAARARWDRTTAALVDGMVMAASAGGPPERGARESLTSLPSPVRRYFASALPPDIPAIRAARLESAGTFRQIAPGDGRGPEDAWIPFSATQTFTVDPPGFVWAARMKMMPLMEVEVRDGYTGGRGSMQAAVLGLWTVADAHDEPELNSGALLRYLAESPWLPAALLPGPRLTWSAIDEAHASAALRDGSTAVSATFEFNADGDIVSVTADRQMAVNGGFALTPWRGRFWQHEIRNGLRIPLRGEVSWMLDDAWRPYWRGLIVRAEYELAPSHGARP